MAAKIDAIAGSAGWTAVFSYENGEELRLAVAFWGLVDGTTVGFVCHPGSGISFLPVEDVNAGLSSFRFEAYEAPRAAAQSLDVSGDGGG